MPAQTYTHTPHTPHTAHSLRHPSHTHVLDPLCHTSHTCAQPRALNESRYFHRYLWVHPWEYPFLRITYLALKTPADPGVEGESAWVTCGTHALRDAF